MISNFFVSYSGWVVFFFFWLVLGYIPEKLGLRVMSHCGIGIC